MNRDTHAAFQSLPKFLCATALLLILCVPLNADLIFSFDFYDVGTTNPLTQPIMVGDMFDMAITATDSTGASEFQAGLLDWTFDVARLAGPAVGTPGGATFNSVFADLGHATTAIGGTFNGLDLLGNSTNPIEILRAKYTATATGSAAFSTAGSAGPGATFTTTDGRGWDQNGVQVSPVGGTEVVQFGTGEVIIVPEPSSIAFLLMGLMGLVARRR
jgi:hypothetical protein